MYDEITYVENITRECFNLNLKIACGVSHFVFNILKGKSLLHTYMYIDSTNIVIKSRIRVWQQIAEHLHTHNSNI